MSNPFDTSSAQNVSARDSAAVDAEFTEVNNDPSQGNSVAQNNEQSAQTQTTEQQTTQNVANQPATQTNVQQNTTQQPAQTVLTQNQGSAVSTATQNTGVAVANTIGLGVVDEVDFDTEIDLGNLERFPKLAKGETSRIAFVLMTPKGTPAIKMTQIFWIEELKKTFIAPKDPTLLAECVKLLGEPKVRFGTVIVRYHTDKDGTLLSPRIEHLALTFATDKWPLFKSLAREWPLNKHDVIIVCTEAEFQKWTPQAASQYYVGTDANFFEQVQAKARNLYDNRLDRRLGQQMEDAEIRNLLNQYRNLKNQGGQFNGSNPFNQGGQGNAGNGAQTPAGGNPFAAQGAANQVKGEDFSNLLAEGGQQ